MPSGRYQLASDGNDVISVYRALATQYSVSHVGAQLAGAKDGKRRRQRAAAACVPALWLCKSGHWVRGGGGGGDLNAPPSFSELGEVLMSPNQMAHSPTFALHLASCVSLANGEPGKARMALLMLGYSSDESHSRETEQTHNPNHGESWGLVLPASLCVQLDSELGIGVAGYWVGVRVSALAQRTGCTLVFLMI